MNSERQVKGIYKWKPLGNRTADRQKNRWYDNVMKDLKLQKIKKKKRTKCIQNKEEWRRIVENVKIGKE
jgi:hypothetical protein